MFDPAEFVPAPQMVKEATSHPSPYEFAWRVSHDCRSISDAIDRVSDTLGVGYDLASSLVWAEMSSQSPLVPA